MPQRKQDHNPTPTEVIIAADELADAMSRHKLTERKALWCCYMVEHMDATRAAREAGYAEASASLSGFANRRHAGCKAFMAELMISFTHRVNVTADMVLANALYMYNLARANGDVPMMRAANEQLGKHKHVKAFISVKEDVTPPRQLGEADVDRLGMLSADELELYLRIRGKLASLN